MKTYQTKDGVILYPTKEKRVPKVGEWYIDCFERINKMNDIEDVIMYIESGKRQILTPRKPRIVILP